MEDINELPQAPKLYTQGDLVEGSLVHGTSGDKVRYLPVVMSRLSFTVLSDQDLKQGDQFLLKAGPKETKVVLSGIEQDPHNKDLKQFKMNALDPKTNLEELISSLKELEAIQDRLQIRSERLEALSDFFVNVRTFGSMDEYKLRIDNVSKSGMKVLTQEGEGAPFSINTVVEMVIDPNKKWLDRSLPCIGKMMRREEHTDFIEFGLRFVENTDSFNHYWGLWVDKLEAKMAADKPQLKAVPDSAMADQDDDDIDLDDLSKIVVS